MFTVGAIAALLIAVGAVVVTPLVLCGTPKFGLVRQRMVTFNGSLHFCSKKCFDDYRKRVQQEVRKRKFLDNLVPRFPDSNHHNVKIK